MAQRCLKLSFTNIQGLRSNFVDCESFLESNSLDILALCETNLDNTVLEGKTGKEISKSLILEFIETFSANNFALSDAEDNTSTPLNRGGIADLPLLKTLLAICEKYL